MLKDTILIESKTFVNLKYEKDLNRIEDKLSIAFDLIELSNPYGTRIISTLLSYFILNKRNNTIISDNEEYISEVYKNVLFIKEKYNINCDNIYNILVQESVNQSIKSNVGQSYESRVRETLVKFVDEINDHKHDSKVNSVEYDFVFMVNNKAVGVSVKRTLRERYKQNFEDVDYLDVDYMLLITLGNDLQENKLNNILQKKGHYVVVASEVYENNNYLKNNDRVISSEKIVEQIIKHLK